MSDLYKKAAVWIGLLCISLAVWLLIVNLLGWL